MARNIMSLVSSMREARQPEGQPPPAVGGWLGLLCRILLLWQPLSLAVIGSSALNSLSVRGLPLAFMLVGRLIVAAFGIGAGLALLRRRAGAVAMAKASLILSAVSDIFIYTTPYFPNNRPPGDTTLILAASLAWYAVWLIYLFRSKRVRLVYGTAGTDDGL
jgi:hypothetical protein